MLNNKLYNIVVTWPYRHVNHSTNRRQTTYHLFTECLHSAKKRHMTYPLFAECLRGCTRQRRRMCPPRAPAVRRPGSQPLGFAVCSHKGTWQSLVCWVPNFHQPAKASLCWVSFVGTRQPNFFPFAFKIFSCLLKLEMLLTCDIWYIYQLLYYISSFYFVCWKLSVEVKYKLQVGRNFKIIKREMIFILLNQNWGRIRKRTANLKHLDHKTRSQIYAHSLTR